MNIKPFFQSTKGVTLIEILISLVILVMVSSALSSGTNYLTRRLVNADFSMKARGLAYERLEHNKSNLKIMGKKEGEFGPNFPGFSYEEELSPAKINNETVNSLCSYKLKILWASGFNQNSLQLETCIPNDSFGSNNIPTVASGSLETND